MNSRKADNNRVSYWIFYPGDFEHYHAMVQNFSRSERGKNWPAYWKSEGFRNRVVFKNTLELSEPTTFKVYANCGGYILCNEEKFRIGEEIAVAAGSVSISVHAACIEKFPAIYVESPVIVSDHSWMVDDYCNEPVKAGYSRYFTRKEQDPCHFEMTEECHAPIRMEEINGGVLYEFESEYTAQISVIPAAGGENHAETADHTEKADRRLIVYPGESREEALDTVLCYQQCPVDPVTGLTERAAVHFLFVPDCRSTDYEVTARHQYLDIPVKVSFHSDDEELNRIWDVAVNTFRLCSGVFFIDGIKRDRWIWSGDAYQSYLVNECLFRDPEINRRTLLALAGNSPITTHINTITDYTMLWILGACRHIMFYNDVEFMEMIYPKMVEYMNFLEAQVNQEGFFIGRPGDWIYIDWADMDKTGALCAEQMLYIACLRAMQKMQDMQGQSADDHYIRKADMLLRKLNIYFWDSRSGAYIDSYESGKNNITRHANIFAIIYDIATEEQKRSIVQHVLFNDAVPAITTPYFKFYEMDALCRMGYTDDVLAQVRSYWGGMLKKGAVTFWEEYDPAKPDEEQYIMYGDPFSKSLCHAWAASPIYLFSKYLKKECVTEEA